MLKPLLTDKESSGGAFTVESCGPRILLPASAKLNGALDSEPPRWRFSPNVLLIRKVGEIV